MVNQGHRRISFIFTEDKLDASDFHGEILLVSDDISLKNELVHNISSDSLSTVSPPRTSINI